MLAVVVDAAGVDQDGVGVKQGVARVDLLLQLVYWENNVLDMRIVVSYLLRVIQSLLGKLAW